MTPEVPAAVHINGVTIKVDDIVTISVDYWQDTVTLYSNLDRHPLLYPYEKKIDVWIEMKSRIRYSFRFYDPDDSELIQLLKVGDFIRHKGSYLDKRS